MPENESNLIALLDEDGQEHTFEVVDSLEVDGERYMAMIPTFDVPEEVLEDAGELVVLKVKAEGDEEFLETIEDEDEFNRIAETFMERLEEYFDFEDEDE